MDDLGVPLWLRKPPYENMCFFSQSKLMNILCPMYDSVKVMILKHIPTSIWYTSKSNQLGHERFQCIDISKHGPFLQYSSPIRHKCIFGNGFFPMTMIAEVMHWDRYMFLHQHPCWFKRHCWWTPPSSAEQIPTFAIQTTMSVASTLALKSWSTIFRCPNPCVPLISVPISVT